jgi:hypothetical protein
MLVSTRLVDPEIGIAELFAGDGHEASPSRTAKLPVT